MLGVVVSFDRDRVAWRSLDCLIRIDTQGTTPYKLGRSKEGSATTRPTIQKISDDHVVLLEA
jgi:hypothetical protein